MAEERFKGESMIYHKDITLTWVGKPTPFRVGDRVQTRGDIGSIRGFRVTKVHNEWFCECRDWLFRRHHFNMAFLEPRS